MDKLAVLRKLAFQDEVTYTDERHPGVKISRKVPRWFDDLRREGFPVPAQTNQTKPEPRGGGVVAEPPLEVAEPPLEVAEPPAEQQVRIDPRTRRPRSVPQKPATPKMTREEWLRMGQENGWGGASNDAPAKPAEFGQLVDDKWLRIMKRFRQSRLFPNGSRSPISSGDVRPSWGSQWQSPVLGWKEGDPVPPGYEVMTQMTYPPKGFLVPKRRAL